MTEKARLYLLDGVVLVLVAALVLGGCGGGGSGLVSIPATTPGGTFGDYATGPTGSLVFRMAWPSTGTRTIPEAATTVGIEVTGEGLAQAVTTTIQRPADKATVDNLPSGQKGVAATARDASGKALAYGAASVVVEAGKEKEATLTLQPIEEAGVAQARAMVQEVRDSSVALGEAFSGEIINQAAVWSADLVPTFALTMQRLDFIAELLHPGWGGGAVPATVGGVSPTAGARSRDILGPEGQYFGDLMDLPTGKYQAILHTDPWSGFHTFELQKVGDTAENTWIVLGPQGDALLKGMEITLTRVPKTNNLGVDEGQLSVTSTEDASLAYQASLTLEADGQSRVTKMTIAGSFKDKYLPSGLTVDGAFTGEPLGNDSYKTAAFTGSIKSDKLSLSVEQASVAFEPPTATPDLDGWSSFVKSAELRNLVLQTANVEEPIRWAGTLSLPEMVIDDKVLDQGPYPKKGEWKGTYDSSALSYEGTLSFDWQNPQRHLTELPNGTVSLMGRLAARNKPVFSTSLTLTTTRAPGYTLAIDLTRGDKYLRGNLTGSTELDIDGHVKITDWSLSLKNENDLSVAFAKSTDGGTVTDRTGVKLADIQKDPDLKLWVLRYIDGTIESLAPSGFAYDPVPIIGTVTGRVVDAKTGKPIAWASVSSGYDGVSTDSEGKFELKALKGSQVLMVWYQWAVDGPKQVTVEVVAGGVANVGDIQLEIARNEAPAISRFTVSPTAQDFFGGGQVAYTVVASDPEDDWLTVTVFVTRPDGSVEALGSQTRPPGTFTVFYNSPANISATGQTATYTAVARVSDGENTVSSSGASFTVAAPAVDPPVVPPVVPAPNNSP